MSGRGGERVEEGDGAGVGLYTCGADQVQYQVVLAIAQAADGLLAQGLGGGVGVLALGQLDGARCQEGAHSVVPRTSVDVGEVVLIGVRRARAAAGEEIGEHLEIGRASCRESV